MCESDQRQAGAHSQLVISADRLDEAIDLLTSYDPNYHREEDVVRSIAETILGLHRPDHEESEPAKPQQPQDYVVLDGAVYAAAVKQRDDRSMVADLYRNDADYRAGKPMERSVKLELD